MLIGTYEAAERVTVADIDASIYPDPTDARYSIVRGGTLAFEVLCYNHHKDGRWPELRDSKDVSIPHPDERRAPWSVCRVPMTVAAEVHQFCKSQLETTMVLFMDVNDPAFESGLRGGTHCGPGLGYTVGARACRGKNENGAHGRVPARAGRAARRGGRHGRCLSLFPDRGAGRLCGRERLLCRVGLFGHVVDCTCCGRRDGGLGRVLPPAPTARRAGHGDPGRGGGAAHGRVRIHGRPAGRAPAGGRVGAGRRRQPVLCVFPGHELLFRERPREYAAAPVVPGR